MHADQKQDNEQSIYAWTQVNLSKTRKGFHTQLHLQSPITAITKEEAMKQRKRLQIEQAQRYPTENTTAAAAAAAAWLVKVLCVHYGI